MMILFWGGIIALAVVIIRGLSGSTGSRRAVQTRHASALDILEERFARGEIDKEELEAIRDELST